MSPDNFFPQELIDTFIECLSIDPPDESLDSRYALASCALVCKSFSAPARRHLFATIKLTPYKVEDPSSTDIRINYSHQSLIRRIQVLAQILAQETSDLTLLMRTLHIEIDDDYTMLNDGSCLDQVLKIVSSRARNLENLHFEGFIEQPLSWTTIRADITQPLTTICRSESMRTLQLRYILQFPTSLIAGSPSLLSLTLLEVTLSDSTIMPLVTERVSTRLEELRIYAGIRYFWDPSSSMGPIISKIKSFRGAVINDQDDLAFAKILRQASDTLISLDVIFVGSRTKFMSGKSTDLRALPSLCDVVFELQILSQRTTLPTTKHLITFLNHTVIPMHIQTVRLGFNLRVLSDALDRFVPDEDEGLTSLGRSILENKFPVLQKMVFSLAVWLNNQSLTPRYIDEMERSLSERILSLIIPPTSQSNSTAPRVEVIVTLITN